MSFRRGILVYRVAGVILRCQVEGVISGVI